MAKKPELEEWWVFDNSPYSDLQRISGRIYGDKRFVDSTRVCTNIIVEGSGNVVKTASGTEYVLKTPHPEYVEWCKSQGCHVPTADNPVSWKGDHSTPVFMQDNVS